MLNRAALIVRPAAPFLAWAKSLDDSGALPNPGGEQTVYLVPEFGTDPEGEDVLRLVYHVELHSVVEDICADPLEDDDEV